MAELLGFISQWGVVLALLALGFGVGSYRERKHLRELAQNEQELRGVGVTSHKRVPAVQGTECLGLVTGSVVVATDYFKVFVSSLRNLFGGEMKSFVTLVARARREATVRMLLEARALGANAVYNIRIETATIGGQDRRKRSHGVEVLAYGTALKVPETGP
jgi:uncharacterized protein YbjQ (UPF0145 family)